MKHFFSLLRGWPVALLALLWLAGPAARAQAPAWQMSITTPGTSITMKALAAGGNGNLILAGYFSNTATFGATTLTSTGSGSDGFVAKWNPTAGFVWAQAISGTDAEYVTAVAVSGSSIYVGGTFSGRIANIGNSSLPNADAFGNTDLFVARLTDLGGSSTIDWATRAGGPGSETLAGLALNGTSLYLAGSFSGATTTLGTIALSNAAGTTGAANIFVAKLTDTGLAGTIGWALAAGSATGGDQATAVAVSGNSIYVAGNFRGTATRFGSLTLATAGSTDLFVAKLLDTGSAGSFTWVLQAGGPAQELASALVSNGPVLYLAGSFSSPSLPVGGHTLVTAGGADVLVARLTDAGSSGRFDWAQAAGGAGTDVALALTTSGPNVFATGYFSSAPASFGSTTLASVGQGDVFLTKLTDAGTTGTFAWAQQAGGPALDQADAVVVQGTQVYVAGTFFSPNLGFGSTIPALVRPGAGYGLFLASLLDPTLTATTAAQSSLPFTLAPNPARASTTVLLPALPGAATATLTLRDALGRALRTATVALPAAGLRHEVDLTGLPAGLYAVQVQAGAATATHRLVVE